MRRRHPDHRDGDRGNSRTARPLPSPSTSRPTPAPSSSGAFSILVRPADLTDDEDLTISASITVTDAAGNTDTITDTQTYTYNETRPAVDITGFSEDTGAPGDFVTSDNELTFFGTAAPFVTIEIFRSSGGGVVGQGVADADGNWSVDTTVLPTGTWNFFATPPTRSAMPASISSP